MKKLVLLCALTFAALLPVCADATVAFVNKGTVHTNNTPTSPTTDTSLTIASGTNLVLVVYVVAALPTATIPIAVTWGGTTVPIISAASLYNGNTSSQIDIFCLPNPATGNLTLSVSWTGTLTSNVDFIDAVFSGANQTTPCTNGTSGFSATSAPFSLSVTGATGDIAIGFYNTANSSLGTLSGTTLFTNTAGNNTNDAGNYAPGSSSTALTFNTAANTVGVAVDIAAAGGGASCTHSGYTNGGALATPNGTTGSYVGKSGAFVTPDCSTINYWQPAVGNFGTN